MMKHRILIIDDRWKERNNDYQRLVDAMSDSRLGFQVEIEFLESPNKLTLLLKQNSYSCAIVDAVLNETEEWKNYSIDIALHTIGKKIPIAIVSNQWDNTNSKEIGKAWAMQNCRTFLHWRDINSTGGGQIDYAVQAMHSMICDAHNLNFNLELEHNEPIRIVHISDIQVGGIEAENLKLEANRCADSILEHWCNKPPTFVALTGDVAEHGSPSQYSLAYEWLSYFLQRLDIDTTQLVPPSPRLLFVPGNHDVNLRLATATRISLCINDNNGIINSRLEETTQEDLLDYAYAPYREFLSQLTSCTYLSSGISDKHSFAWVEPRFRHLGVVFYGLNTAQPVNATSLPGRQVCADALANIGLSLKTAMADCKDKRPLIIGLSHHSPQAADGDGGVTNPGVFTKFFQGAEKTALFLHGHIHEHDLQYTSNDGIRLVRSCATTLTKKEKNRPCDSLRGFNLLELTRENHVISGMHAFSFGWVGSQLIKVKEAQWCRSTDGMFFEQQPT